MWSQIRIQLSSINHEGLMTKTIRVAALAMVWTLGSVVAARAQTPAPAESQISAGVSIGGQFGTRTISGSSSFVLSNELATISATQTVGSGVVFDIYGGYRVWRRLSVALGVSTFTSSGDGSLTGSIPDPSRFGNPKVTSATATGLGHTDVAVNFQVMWRQPIMDKLDATIFLGPSLIHVKQDFLTGSVPTGTQNITATTTTESKSTGKAGSAGVDISYQITPRYGAGFFVRYLGGEVDLPSAPKMKVGGAQVGGGLRVRF